MTDHEPVKHTKDIALLFTAYQEQKTDLQRYSKSFLLIILIVIVCFYFQIFTSMAYAILFYFTGYFIFQIISFLYQYRQIAHIKQKYPTHTQPVHAVFTQPSTDQPALHVHQDIDPKTLLTSEMMDYQLQVFPLIRVRHRTQMKEIYQILSEVMVKKTQIQRTEQHQQTLNTLNDDTFLNLQTAIEHYLTYTQDQRFLFQAQLQNIPDLWLSQQLNQLLDGLLIKIEFLYQQDLIRLQDHQHFLQQQLNTVSAFQVQHEDSRS